MRDPCVVPQRVQTRFGLAKMFRRRHREKSSPSTLQVRKGFFEKRKEWSLVTLPNPLHVKNLELINKGMNLRKVGQLRSDQSPPIDPIPHRIGYSTQPTVLVEYGRMV